MEGFHGSFSTMFQSSILFHIWRLILLYINFHSRLHYDRIFFSIFSSNSSSLLKWQIYTCHQEERRQNTLIDQTKGRNICCNITDCHTKGNLQQKIRNSFPVNKTCAPITTLLQCNSYSIEWICGFYLFNFQIYLITWDLLVNFFL